MGKTKSKRGSFWQAQMLPFVLLWGLSIGAVGVISRFIPLLLPFLLAEDKVSASLIISTVLTGLVQVVLVERLLKKSMQGWMFYTIPSAFITLFLNSVLPSIYFGTYPLLSSMFTTYNALSSLALHMPVTILQFFWLRRHVHRAWLWPLFTLPLLVAFTAVPYGEEQYQIIKMVTLLSVGVVQAGLMHYFWQHPKDETHFISESDSSEDLDNTRVERLQEHDQSPPVWDQGQDQGLQADAL